MKLDQHLARTMLTLHPLESSRILETMPPEEAAPVLLDLEPRRAASVVWNMARAAAAAVLAAMPPDRGGSILAALPVDVAAHVLRLLEDAPRDALLAAVRPRVADALRPLLSFQEGTAGVLMDPNILSLQGELRVSEALQRIRRRPEETPELLPVVDPEQKLTGTVPLTALLISRPEARVSALERPAEHVLTADAGLAAIRRHPGWQEATSLFVVDNRGVLIGMFHAHHLRRLEDEAAAAEAENETARALGELFRAGFGALVSSVLAPDGSPSTRRRQS